MCSRLPASLTPVACFRVNAELMTGSVSETSGKLSLVDLGPMHWSTCHWSTPLLVISPAGFLSRKARTTCLGG